MKSERIKAVLQEGHKEAAVEVPFDPGTRWSLPSTRLLPGRHGHRVQGRLNGVQFESVVLPRGPGFYLIIGEELRSEAQVTIGDVVEITLHPLVPLPSHAPAPSAKRRPRGTRNPAG
jgi:hypothetical protein